MKNNCERYIESIQTLVKLFFEYQDLKNRIERALHKCKTNKEELAAMEGVSPGYIEEIETILKGE